jgi:hypothetical protein
MHATGNGTVDNPDMRRTRRRAEMLTREMRPRNGRTGETWTGDTEAMRRHSRAMMDRRRAAEDLHR